MTDHDKIAELIRSAGKRPEVPDDELLRIRAAAYAGWKERVGKRPSRRGIGRFMSLAAAALILMAVGGWYWHRWSEGSGAGASIAQCLSVIGAASIQIGSVGEDRPVTAGEEIPAGARLTTSADGRVALRTQAGYSVRVDVASSVRLLTPSRIGLDAGTVYVDSGPEPASEPLTIVTSLGTIQDVGTQFETRLLGSALRVRVREGTVRVNAGSGVHDLTAGSAMELAEDGAVIRAAIPAYGPEWDWIAGVTPMMAVEGRPLREFLEWMARERGWTLTFADDRTSERANTITVSGSIEGLTLDQALETVLATSRLTYRVEQGVLRITGPPK